MTVPFLETAPGRCWPDPADGRARPAARGVPPRVAETDLEVDDEVRGEVALDLRPAGAAA